MFCNLLGWDKLQSHSGYLYYAMGWNWIGPMLNDVYAASIYIWFWSILFMNTTAAGYATQIIDTGYVFNSPRIHSFKLMTFIKYDLHFAYLFLHASILWHLVWN